MEALLYGKSSGNITKKKPSNYALLQAFTSNTSWTVPETGWYRIFCVGASGDGQKGTAASSPGYGQSRTGGGGSGGNSGAVAVSEYYLNAGKTITVTASKIASFGTEMSAEAGLSGTTYDVSYSGSASEYSYVINGRGLANKTTAKAYGGTIVNADGFIGGNGGGGTTGASTKAERGGNQGGAVATSNTSAGGGGARYSDVAPINKYITPPSSMTLYGPCSGSAVASSATNVDGFPYQSFSSPNIILSGGGGGGSGGYASKSDDGHTRSSPSGVGGQGQPAIVIIEKGVYE